MSNLIQRVNMYPCPVGMGNIGTSSESNGTEWSIEDGVLTIADGTARRPYVYFVMDDLTPGGRYVLACDLEASAEVPDEEVLILIYSKGWDAIGQWSKSQGGEAAVHFTVPDDGYANFRFYSRGGTVKVSRINIESEATFDESLPFFYYGTMPYPRSA